jgi:gluconolactonase
VFHEFFPGRGGDGMAVDVEGNLYVAAGMHKPRGTTETLDVKTGVYVFSPAGKLVEHIPIPLDIITNVAFGGPDLKTLYVTSGTTLYKVPNKIAGTRR